ncbi:MAG: hypothetical protein KDA44_04610 [Planctomycetales bacterium]|nr:hypothetical protein [Planctomycetales bacterium]
MLQFIAAVTVAVAASSSPALAEIAVDQTPALNWHSDYGTALEATRKDARPLLIVIDAPQDAKQSVSADLLTADATEKLLAKYDLCRVDATTPYGKKVADAFGAKTFPHVAIIDKAGAVVLHKQSGAAAADQLPTVLAKFQSGERVSSVAHTTYFRGDATASNGVSMSSFNSGVQSQPTVTSPGYCPSCQRQAMGY